MEKNLKNQANQLDIDSRPVYMCWLNDYNIRAYQLIIPYQRSISQCCYSTIIVQTEYPGTSQPIRYIITKPLEKNLKSKMGFKKITSNRFRIIRYCIRVFT
jgi:hypothetical protein